MERNILKNMTDIEERITQCVDLLKIAKIYCEQNYDKSDEIIAINTLLEVILSNQKVVSDKLETLLTA